VNEIVGRVNIAQCCVQGGAVKHIALDHLGRWRNSGQKEVGLSSHASDLVLVRFQHFEKSTADVAGGTSEQYAVLGSVRVHVSV